MTLVLPSNLINAVREQNAVLFLGAGASYGALAPTDHIPVPPGLKLRDLLCDKFLDGALKDRSLAAVAEYSANETDLLTVQEYVRDLFEPYAPADFHNLIGTFRWWAIATTNYDLIVDRAYTKNALQQLVKRYKDGDGFDSRLRKETHPLEYIKLHGCIDHYTDTAIPLILGQEQYARYLKNRTRLFNRLRDLAHEHPIIFCGYRIEDPHVQQLLFDLADTQISRPMYYYVSPDVGEYEIRYWAKHRITAIKATFEEFLTALDKAIPSSARSLVSSTGGGSLSIRKHYRVAGAVESSELKTFLERDVLHIRADMPVEYQDPAEFYKGYDRGWGAIAQNLDVRRRITDSVLVDAVLADDAEQKTAEISILMGPAGNGKTVALKRIAWEAAVTYEKLVLFLHETGSIKISALKEIHELTGKRIFLFVDRLVLKRTELHQTLQSCKARGIPITIIGADRANEWDTFGQHLAGFVRQEFDVHYLSEPEINDLLDLLTKHKALGLLSDRSRQQQVGAFVDRAQRQLLVALHEATLGLPFETILKDEYDSIPSAEARRMYLAICALHQFGAYVRAGLIYRTIGIDYSEFKSKLIAPLRDVVFAQEDRYSKDYYYRARHQHVAEIVFNQALPNQSDRFDLLISLMTNMNTDYTSDEETFAAIIKGRNISRMFSSAELGRLLYDTAQSVSPNESHVLHQRAIFEMRHQGGSLELASEFAEEAAELNRNPSNLSINHTRADIARRRADRTDDPLLKESLRRSARMRLEAASNDEYYLHTRALLAIDQLRDLLEQARQKPSKTLDNLILEATKDAETAIQKGQQISSDSPEMLTAEATLREVLDQDEKAEKALEKAFELNHRQDWLAVRLARRYISAGSPGKAQDILARCLVENPGSKIAHFAMAKLLMQTGSQSNSVLDHLKSSFSSGDDNFDAQFFYARELFIRGSFEASKVIFASIDQSAPSNFRKLASSELLDEDGSIRELRGQIRRKEEGYAFIRFDAFADDVFASRGDTDEKEWDKIASLQLVTGRLSFTRRGPRATQLSTIQ